MNKPKILNKKLTDEQKRIIFEHGTEPPFSGQYVYSHDNGVFSCANCGNPLFSSLTKFDSGSGWPSFWEPIGKKAVRLVPDVSHGMERTEVTCANCGAHLGHVFSDGPQPTGERFCINSAALELRKELSKQDE